MLKLLALALAVGPIATGPGTEYYAGMPPEQYWGRASVKLIVTAPEQLAPVCGIKLPEPTDDQVFTLYGCTRQVGGQTFVIIPDPCLMGGYEQTAAILCHELAHAKGWPANHPMENP